MRFIGIDGGRAGAYVEVGPDGLTALDLIEWRGAATPPVLPVRAGDVVALEAAYVGKNPQSAMKLQLWRGQLMATFPAGVQLLEPLATAWRAKVLRRAGMRREVAKAVAIEAAKRNAIGLPDDFPDHVAEAWCLARYAWGWATAPRRNRRRS